MPKSINYFCFALLQSLFSFDQKFLSLKINNLIFDNCMKGKYSWTGWTSKFIFISQFSLGLPLILIMLFCRTQAHSEGLISGLEWYFNRHYHCFILKRVDFLHFSPMKLLYFLICYLLPLKRNTSNRFLNFSMPVSFVHSAIFRNTNFYHTLKHL